MVSNWYDCDGKMLGSSTFPGNSFRDRYGNSTTAVLYDIRASRAREIELCLLPGDVNAELLHEVLRKMFKVSIRNTMPQIASKVLCDVLAEPHCLIARLDLTTIDADQATLDGVFAANTSLREVQLLSDFPDNPLVDLVSAIAKNRTIETVVWRGSRELPDRSASLLRTMPSLTLVDTWSFSLGLYGDAWEQVQHSWFCGARRSPDIVPYDYRADLPRRQLLALHV